MDKETITTKGNLSINLSCDLHPCNYVYMLPWVWGNHFASFSWCVHSPQCMQGCTRQAITQPLVGMVMTRRKRWPLKEGKERYLYQCIEPGCFSCNFLNYFQSNYSMHSQWHGIQLWYHCCSNVRYVFVCLLSVASHLLLIQLLLRSTLQPSL